MFMDASVILAILLQEPEESSIVEALAEQLAIATSAIAVFEASTRLVTMKRISFDEAFETVIAFVERAKADILPIGVAEARRAHVCAALYHHLTGHPARLNMGDCFAYAVARTSGLKLAYKGNDFLHTDIDGVRFGP